MNDREFGKQRTRQATTVIAVGSVVALGFTFVAVSNSIQNAQANGTTNSNNGSDDGFVQGPGIQLGGGGNHAHSTGS